MKKLTIVTFLLLFVTLATPAQAQGPPDGMDVTVINTPNVDATVVNEPIVHIGTMPEPLQVEIANGNSSEREPFQATGGVDWTDCCVGANIRFTVPDGKRLIVDNFTAQAQLNPADADAILAIETTVNGVTARHSFPLELMLTTIVGGGASKGFSRFSKEGSFVCRPRFRSDI